MGYYKESCHAKSFEVTKGIYCLCDLGNFVDLTSIKDAIGDISLLTFSIPDTIDRIDGFYGGKCHFTFPISTHQLILVPMSLIEAFEWEIDAKCGIKMTLNSNTLCYETPECIKIGEYTIYKQQSSQEDQDENEDEEEGDDGVVNDAIGNNNIVRDTNDENDRDVCPVCYGKEDYLMKYPCGHSVCFFCLREMMKGQFNRCPTCRRNMVDSQETLDDVFEEDRHQDTQVEVSSLEVDEQIWIAGAYERLKGMPFREQRRYVYNLCERMEGSCSMEDFRRGGRFGTFALRMGYVINQEDTR